MHVRAATKARTADSMGDRDLERLVRVVLIFLLGDFSDVVELLLPSGASKLVGFRDFTFRFCIVAYFCTSMLTMEMCFD